MAYKRNSSVLWRLPRGVQTTGYKLRGVVPTIRFRIAVSILTMVNNGTYLLKGKTIFLSRVWHSFLCMFITKRRNDLLLELWGSIHTCDLLDVNYCVKFQCTQSQKMGTQHIIELFCPCKVNQIANVNATTLYSTTNALANSSCPLNCKWERTFTFIQWHWCWGSNVPWISHDFCIYPRWICELCFCRTESIFVAWIFSIPSPFVSDISLLIQWRIQTLRN